MQIQLSSSNFSLLDNSSEPHHNNLPEQIFKVNSQRLCPKFLSGNLESLDIFTLKSKITSPKLKDLNEISQKSARSVENNSKNRKNFENQSILTKNSKKSILYDNFPFAEDSCDNSYDVSLNEKCELKEIKYNKKLNSTKRIQTRKSFSICVSNSPQIIVNDKKEKDEKKIEKIDEKLLALPRGSILLNSVNHSLLKVVDGLPGMKKRASFQIPPTYGDKKPNDEFSLLKTQKINSITSLKNQNRLESLKSFHKSKTRKDNKFSTIMKTAGSKTQTAFYQVISNLYLTKKFISILKNLTSFRKPKWLKKLHFDMMNDLSFDYRSYQRFQQEKKEKKIKSSFKKSKNFILAKLFFEKFKELLIYSLEFMPIFDPNKKISIFWDSLVISAICFYFIVIPLDISFLYNIFEELSELYIIKLIFLYVLCFDVLKCCSSSYYHKGLLVKNRKKILVNYIKTHFLIDLITISPLLIHQICYHYNLSLSIYDNTWYLELFQLVFFVRYRHFIEISKKLGELVFIDKTIQSTVSLIKLIFRIMILSHIFACIWYMIGNNNIYPQDNWIVLNGLYDSPWWKQYLYAYYFVCVTMNTVGYGDITPHNPLEILFVIVFIFVACGIFAYSLNSIGIIVSDIWKRQNEFSKDLNIINQFMQEKNINFDLTMRVRKYLEYIWNEEKLEEVEQQVRIINKLSDSLKDELLLEANGPVIREIKLFSLNFSEEMLRQIISIMKEVRFTPGDVIFTKNDLSNALYILRRGEVELFLERSHSCNEVTILKKLHPGEIFGELSFFTNSERTTSARSTDFTNVFMIKQQDFLEILRKNSKDFQRFCEIKDNIQIFDHYDDLFLRCFSCKSVAHQLRYCPLLHYIPKEDIIIQRHNYSELQNRTNYKGKRVHKMNCRRNLEKIEKCAYKLQEEIFPRHETSSSEHTDDENDEEDDEADVKSNGHSEDSNISNNKAQKPLISLDDSQLKSSINNDNNEEVLKSSMNLVKSNNDTEENIQRIHSQSHSRMVKRRNSKKHVLWKKEASKKSFSNLVPQISQKDLLGMLKESFFKNFEKKSTNITEDNNSQREKFEKIIDNLNFNIPVPQIVNALPRNSEFIKKEEIPDIDKVKSFEDYYPHNNIETVIHEMEIEKFKKLNKKLRKCNFLKSKYQMFIQNNLNINESIPTFLRGSTLYDKRKATFLTANASKNERYIEKTNDRTQPLMKRYYFKNSINLQKLIAQEKFDPEKIKEYYRKKYIKEAKRKLFMKVMKKYAKLCSEALKKLVKCIGRRKKSIKK